jgi:hypothetical protein
VNTHSLLSVFNRKTNLDAGTSINMHAAVKAQANPSKLFITVPWAMAFKDGSDECYVISAASDIVVKVKVDPGTGLATVQKDLDPTRVLQIKVGKNPRGIVVNGSDTRAYVMNYISRDVSVLDLSLQQEQVITTMASADLPVPTTFDDKLHIGKELFNMSLGEFDAPAAGKPAVTGRMSNNGWGSCSSCHPFGLTDNVVWLFGGGPRRTISLRADFDPGDPQRKSQRALNWSAERDEEEDFELNIRNVSGGAGLLVAADGVAADNPVVALAPTANGGRRQLKVRGAGAWDSIKAYVQFGIRSPISPLSKNDPEVIEGGKLFQAAKCQTCHRWYAVDIQPY